MYMAHARVNKRFLEVGILYLRLTLARQGFTGAGVKMCNSPKQVVTWKKQMFTVAPVTSNQHRIKIHVLLNASFCAIECMNLV